MESEGAVTLGFAFRQLSPMVLGPVLLTPHDRAAPNLENCHQCRKVFLDEMPPGKTKLSELTQAEAHDLLLVWNRSLVMSKKAHRHKPLRKPQGDAKEDGQAHARKRQTLFSAIEVPMRGAEESEEEEKEEDEVIVRDKQGRDRRFVAVSYIRSRQFYCNQYEALARRTPHLRRLWEAVRHEEGEGGASLRIMGFDGVDLGGPLTIERARAAYCDESKPFGHEWVLACLVAFGHSNTAQFQRRGLPWREALEPALWFDGVTGRPRAFVRRALESA